jgi:hypothetical protein
MSRHFRSGVPEPKIPRRFLGAIDRERGGNSPLLPALSLACGELVEPWKGPLFVFLQETVAFIFSTCIRVEKLTPHLHFLRDLRVLLFKTLL